MRKDSYLIKVGWFKNMGQRMPQASNNETIPWYTYSAIEFLEKRLKREMSVFEFGSGNSTIWWSRKVSNIVGCEHNREWYRLLKQELTDNVDYLLYDLVPGGDYSKAALNYNEQFDIIVIDGRDRTNCAKNSIHALKPNGVIIWDNADLKELTEGYDFLIKNGFRRLDFTGMVHYGAVGSCTTIFYRTDNCLAI